MALSSGLGVLVISGIEREGEREEKGVLIRT